MIRGSVAELLKPGIALSVVITVLPGMFASNHLPPLILVFWAMLGTLCMAMSSFVYNQILEIRTDALMDRTKDRPLLTGKISILQAHIVGASLLVLGLGVLWILATPLSACIAFFSFAYYLFAYTLYMKPRTVQNTVLGGVCGAIGPLIGQAAMENSINITGIMLFLLLFLWQPPHFWALAIAKKDEYERAHFPMLPVTEGVPATIKSMIVYQVLLVLATAAVVYPLGLAGFVFLIPSLLSAVVTLILILRLRKSPDIKLAMTVFFASIIHNVVWHAAFSLDRFLFISP